MSIPLVIAEFTGRYRRDLRRFTFGGHDGRTCPAHAGETYAWGHDATVTIGEVGEDLAAPHGDSWPHEDPRWPETCQACGYVFTGEDQWQRNDCRIYQRPDGIVFVSWGSLKTVLPGTMWRIPWADEFFSKRHPQHTESWLVILPDGGQWITSQAATGGGHWTVTGTPPNITVSPSIHHNAPHGWHGFIRNGQLEPA